MISRFFTFLFLFVAFSISVFAQRTIQGQVINIIDARTFTVQSGSQKITVRLQAIDVPDQEQPLATTIKDHLGVLILNKSVRAVFKQFYQDEMLCKVYLDGIDVSGQMIRDGAAWFDIPNQDAVDSIDRQVYTSLQDSARTEKLGVWSIQGMLPVWEYQAAKQKTIEDKQKAEEASIENKNNKTAISLGLSQLDINISRINISSSTSNKSVKKVDSNEYEDYEPSENRKPKSDSKMQESLQAVNEMENLMVGLFGKDSLNDFKEKLGRAKIAAALALDKNPNAKLKLYLQNNLKILDDVNDVMSWYIDKNVNGMIYKGDEVERLSGKYSVEPVRNSHGTFVIYRQDMFEAMRNKALKNFIEIKQIIDDASK